MRPCKDVRRLRDLSAQPARRDLARLVTRYGTGARSAAQVVMGLAALEARGLRGEMRWLAAAALGALAPVPTVLWTWACGRFWRLSPPVRKQVLLLAGRDPRYARHYEAARRAAAGAGGMPRLSPRAKVLPGSGTSTTPPIPDAVSSPPTDS
jgi:hypothetical protein